uniref:Uncharacterized protein n=1 Tax=Setaria digitata TaxID=48799 RepID=A0A915PQK0_9BILA
MSGFIGLLDIVCPPFRDFVSEHLQSQKSLKSGEQQHDNAQSDAAHLANDLERFEAQRYAFICLISRVISQQIQEALNRQTYHQFRAYAQQQFVGDPIQIHFGFEHTFRPDNVCSASFDRQVTRLKLYFKYPHTGIKKLVNVHGND